MSAKLRWWVPISGAASPRRFTTQDTLRPLIYQSAWGIDFPDGDGGYLGYLEAIGEFVYADDRKIQRRTGFRRLYDPNSGTFRAASTPDADEEYED